MGNIIRLASGGQIQVRTGVLSGVGPAGPRGLIGPQGPDGGQGPEGPAGPIGQILQVQSKATVSSTTNLVANTNGLISFGTVAYDDMGCISSATNFTFPEMGDYFLSGFLSYASAGSDTGSRQITVVSNINGTLWQATVAPIVGASMSIPFSCTFRTTQANELIQFVGRSTQAVSVTTGTCVVTRVGSGPVGPTGPQGPQGIPGPVGPQGPVGPAGNANSGYATYADLR